MYVQMGDFCVSRGSTTVLLTQISCNTVFSKSQNAGKARTLCTFIFTNLSNFVPPAWKLDNPYHHNERDHQKLYRWNPLLRSQPLLLGFWFLQKLFRCIVLCIECFLMHVDGLVLRSYQLSMYFLFLTANFVVFFLCVQYEV